MSRKNVFGLSDNITGALCYAFGWVSGLVFLIFERENKAVRFHALQSTIWFGLTGIAAWLVEHLLMWIPFVGWLLMSAVSLAIFISWIYMMYTAYKGVQFKIPIIGDVVYEKVYS